jgi:exosortase
MEGWEGRRGLVSRVVLLALAAVAYHGLAVWDPRSHAYTPLEGWLFEASETSPQLVFGLAAVLLLRRRERLRQAFGGEPAPGLAALLLLPGIVLHLWSQLVAAPELMVPSLLLVTVGAAALLGGRNSAREVAICLAVLAFAAPLPGALHNQLVYAFQLATAHGAEWMLQALGWSAVRQGDTLWIGAREFEVIESCSGLRAVQTLTLLAVAWAVFFACRARHAALLVAAAPLLAYAANVARVMVLVVDPRPQVQEAHTAQGVVMFVVGSVGLVLVDHLLLRLMRHTSRLLDDPSRERGTVASSSRRRLAWGLAFCLAGMAVAAVAGPRAAPLGPQASSPRDLPRDLAGWQAGDGPQHGLFLGTVRIVQNSSLIYERDGRSVWAFLAWDDLQRRSQSLLSEKHALPGMGWDVEERCEVVLEPGGVRMEAVVAHRFGKRALVFHGYQGAGSGLGETLRAAFALDQRASPFARTEGVSLLRLSTYIEPGPGGAHAAESLLRDLSRDLARAFDGQIRWTRDADLPACRPG